MLYGLVMIYLYVYAVRDSSETQVLVNLQITALADGEVYL